MIRRGAWARAVVGVLATVWVPVGVAQAHDAPLAAVNLSVDFTERAIAAEARGDSREAARWRLRAFRQDPQRLGDLRQAVEHLEAIDLPAAVRYAAILLEADPVFGLRDPKRLLSLKAAAIEMDTAESYRVAAQLARRLARWASLRPGLKAGRLAETWSEVGELYANADEQAASSEAFGELQRIAVGAGEELDLQTIRWDLVARIHLEANQVERAAIAVGLLADAHGEVREVFTGRARVALRLGEPLAAAAHARRAIRTVEAIWSVDPPYEELVEAYRAINQRDQALAALASYHETDPTDDRLTRLLIDQLVASSREAEAFQIGLERLERALVARDAGSFAKQDLADAAGSWIELAAATRHYDQVTDRLPRVADALDSLHELGEVLGRLPDDEGLEDALGRWCDRVASQIAREDLPAGARRAVAAGGVRWGRPAAAVTCLRSRSAERLAAGEDLRPLADEVELWAYAARLEGSPAVAAEQLRWFLERVESVDDTGGEAVGQHLDENRLNGMRLDLAECLLAIGVPGVKARREVLGLLQNMDLSEGEEPAAWASRVYLYHRLGELDSAITDGERYLGQWPCPEPAAGVDEFSHRAVSATLADALSTQGDRVRATEVYQGLLDRWPDDPVVLNSVAYHWAAPGEPLRQAERMARRAIELDPGKPDFVDTLGWIQFHQGKYAEAASTLREALDLVRAGRATSDLAVVRRHLAAALRRLGRAEEAETIGAP